MDKQEIMKQIITKLIEKWKNNKGVEIKINLFNELIIQVGQTQKEIDTNSILKMLESIREMLPNNQPLLDQLFNKIHNSIWECVAEVLVPGVRESYYYHGIKRFINSLVAENYIKVKDWLSVEVYYGEYEVTLKNSDVCIYTIDYDLQYTESTPLYLQEIINTLSEIYY